MTAYEEMARRVVQDGLIAMAKDLHMEDLLGPPGQDENMDAKINGFTDAIMLGLTETLKPDKIKVYDPEKVAEGLG